MRSDNLKRRDFITLLVGAIAWPLTARAKQTLKLPTIGLLGAGTPSGWSDWVAAFVQRLRELGWIEGRTVAMEVRWGALRPSSTLLDHPSTSAEPLRGGRIAVAILTLSFFALLFMPTPIIQ